MFLASPSFSFSFLENSLMVVVSTPVSLSFFLTTNLSLLALTIARFTTASVIPYFLGFLARVANRLTAPVAIVVELNIFSMGADVRAIRIVPLLRLDILLRFSAMFTAASLVDAQKYPWSPNMTG